MHACIGVELTGKHRKIQWPKSGEEPEPDVTVRLELRQVSVELSCILVFRAL